jgi:murein L,D-transpeptidase YcbB/YkuD
MNLQVLNSKGRVVSPYSINWKSYNKNNFPFTFRQSTGCDNALGVIKFNLTNPYSVYMHDTNVKSVFASAKRYLSHGCIRLERPMELAELLAPGKIDNDLLEACVKGQQPKTIDIPDIPVFVIYVPVEYAADGTIQYLDDVYHLL